MTTELAERPTPEIQMNRANPILQMLEAITAGGITPESASALEKITDLYMRVEAENARKAFAQAKRKLQSRLPHIVATKHVPNNDGSLRYTYAPYQAIMREVEPYLSQHGFSISFSQEVDDKRITAICTLTHVGGHSESNRFAVRAGKGPPGSTETQSDGSASTYAKRFALCNCLNITVDMPDDDARLLGDTITHEQAVELERRLAAIGGSVEGFLRLADAPSFAEIRTASHAMLVRALDQKERMRRSQPSPASPAGRSEDLAQNTQSTPSIGEAWLIRCKEMAGAAGIPSAEFDAKLKAFIRLHGGEKQDPDAVPAAKRDEFLSSIGAD